jgi:uncharacterized protein
MLSWSQGDSFPQRTCFQRVDMSTAIPVTLEARLSWLLDMAAVGVADDGAHDLAHLRRVWATAQQLLQAHPEADVEVVQAAAVLHDLVNLPKNHPQREQASRMAAQQAVALLGAAGFPAGKLDAVAHAIAAHSYSACIAPETIEAQIVQDADRLDALGPVGLARMFYVGGRMGRALAHPTDPLARYRTPDDSLYTLDHVQRKLALLPGSMQTVAARALGHERLAWLQQFCVDFAAQWGEGPEQLG